MKINEIVDGENITLSLDGNFDEISSPKVESKLDDAFLTDAKKIQFDMQHVNYISSAGIRVLILSHKKGIKHGKKIGLVAMSEKVKDVLDVVGILPIFSI